MSCGGRSASSSWNVGSLASPSATDSCEFPASRAARAACSGHCSDSSSTASRLRLPMLASLSGSITHQIATHGVYAVLVLMAIDAIFPAGSELVMVFAGAIAAGAGTRSLHLPGAHLGPGLASYLVLAGAGTLGYLAGSIV